MKNAWLKSGWGIWAILCVIGTVLVTSHWHVLSDQFRLIFLDVGQGDAVLIETPENHTVLVDGGRDERALQQLLETRGYFARTIDLLVITHPDADHIGGLSDIFRAYNVRSVLMAGTQAPESETYQHLLRMITKEGSTVIPARAEETVEMGTLTLDVLYPSERTWGKDVDRQNPHSVVLRGTFQETSFVLPGDITAAEERKLVRSDTMLEADILKAAHHGSDSSTSTAFLKAVDPEMVVISAGQNNRYGHPAEEVLKRIQRQDATIRSTKQEGNIDIVR
jgi:beta-lactamase superfamily II metal-dependent hydrolase